MKRKGAYVLSGLLLFTAPSWGADQSNGEARLAEVERIAEQLQQRVAALEALLAQTPPPKAPIGSPGNAQDIRNWRQLRKKMTESDVERLLGSPTKVDNFGTFIVWAYDPPTGGSVQFDADSGKVEGWHEP